MTAKKEPIDPMLVQAIENNVLLKQVAQQVKEVSEKQEVNHLVAVALRDHNTIQRVDSMWSSFGNIRFLLWAVGAMFALVPLTAAGVTASHYLWGWPR